MSNYDYESAVDVLLNALIDQGFDIGALIEECHEEAFEMYGFSHEGAQVIEKHWRWQIKQRQEYPELWQDQDV